MNGYKGAWHGDPELKAEVLARMIPHREQDEIIQGYYRIRDSEKASGYKGCLVGCTLPGHLEDTKKCSPWDSNRVDRPREGWHRRLELLYGIPADIAHLLDDTFEDQDTFEDAAEFAVASIEAIPVDADLSNLARRYRDDETEINAAMVLEELRNAPLVTP